MGGLKRKVVTDRDTFYFHFFLFPNCLGWVECFRIGQIGSERRGVDRENCGSCRLDWTHFFCQWIGVDLLLDQWIGNPPRAFLLHMIFFQLRWHIFFAEWQQQYFSKVEMQAVVQVLLIGCFFMSRLVIEFIPFVQICQKTALPCTIFQKTENIV